MPSETDTTIRLSNEAGLEAAVAEGAERARGLSDRQLYQAFEEAGDHEQLARLGHRLLEDECKKRGFDPYNPPRELVE